jgi:hypothetical protein
LARASLPADRNAVNPQKITDGLSGKLGILVPMPLVLPKTQKSSPLTINLSGSVNGLTSADNPPPYPVSEESWLYDTAGAGCELLWSLRNYQFKTKLGYTAYAKKDEKWDFSVSAAARFKHGRLSIKAASPEFPEKWNWTISWRLEKK